MLIKSLLLKHPTPADFVGIPADNVDLECRSFKTTNHLKTYLKTPKSHHFSVSSLAKSANINCILTKR
jgi:hypothetical protein